MKHLTTGILLLWAVAEAGAATDPNRLRARIGDVPEQAVWVGQQVPFAVVLSLDTRPKGAPRFEVPDVPGGILLAVPGSPVYGSERREGIAFTTWRYSFAFYPHRSGTHVIPSIRARVHLAQGDGSVVQLTADTEAFTVEAKWPAGATGLATLISTSRLEATESWAPEGTELRVGDAVTRTIRLSAPDVLGMGFPAIAFTPVDGVGVYPKAPEITDKTYRGDITGKRVETVVYLCERAGDITLPGLVIPWFDLAAGELKRVTFPPRLLKVSENPAFPVAPPDAAQVDRGKSRRTVLPGLTLLLAIGAAGLFLVRRYREPARAWAKRRKSRIESSESFLFRQLLSAAQAKDGKGVINRATRWLASLPADAAAPTLTAFAARYGDERFGAALNLLLGNSFGPGDSAANELLWSDPSFINGMTAARKRCISREIARSGVLPTMNPEPEPLPH